MNRRFIIRTLGISLVILLAPFFIKNALASYAASSIGFDINESISDTNYMQFKIETAEHYSVSVRLEDGDGETIEIRFRSQDQYDPGDYKLDEEEDRLTMYFSSNTITYESESFEDLISLFLSEDDDSTFDLTDDPEITRIQISGGMYFNFYSIALADNEDFDDPSWSKDAADWNNLNDFISDGGDILPYHIQFYNTYIQVTNTPLYSSPSYSSPTYFPWGMSNTGWNQPYNYGWNQPSYGWDQPSYGWDQPSYGWNQPYSYGWNQPSYGWNQPSYGWNQPSFGGYQQPYNPYGYQQFFRDDDYCPPINWSSVIWDDEFSGYDPLTGHYFII